MGMVIPAAIASSAWVGYRVVTSSQVFSPTMERKVAPVAIIPTAIAASICRKCRQNGDLYLLRRLTDGDAPGLTPVACPDIRSPCVRDIARHPFPALWPVALAGDG